jgi:hypothetical protein
MTAKTKKRFASCAIWISKRVPTLRTNVNTSGRRAFTFSVRHAPDYENSVQHKESNMASTRPRNEPAPPPVPPPTDSQNRRDNLASGAAATGALSGALSRHMSTPQTPGADRKS